MPSKRSVLSLYSFFGLSSVATPLFFISKEHPEEFLNIQVIGEEYDEESLEELQAQAARAFKKMDDYSFRIFLPCGVGTGWILDYEIPVGANYPTKWYIATNAHVANKFRFVDNEYGQELPIPISKESEKNVREKLRESNPRLGISDTCDLANSVGYFDFNLSRQESGAKLKSNYGGIHNKQMYEPKLFYAPINFLEEDENMGVKADNYRDFAVIEVEFTNEENAEAVTGGFYKKYPLDSKDTINIFAPPLNKQKTWEEIEELYDNFYSLAYPYKPEDHFSYTTNFDNDTGQASWLSKDRNGLSDGKIIKGHVSATAFDIKNPNRMTKWNNKKLNSVGYFYLLEYGAMAGGASGGLVIDKDGNILGIKSLGDEKVSDQSLIVPLRSNEIIEEGVFKSPAYDLILGGGPKQKTSYKQQVENHIFKRDRETWLSRRGNWKKDLEERN